MEGLGMNNLSIKDLDMVLQGNVTIKQWNNEKEKYKTLYSSTHFNVFYLSEELQNMTITAIYADTEDTEQNFIIVEVE